MNAMVRPRWFSRRAWWAIVRVTPELSSSAVLMVGNQNGVMVVKGSTMPAGDAVAPAARLGQTALKSGQSSALSRLPSAGTECARAHQSAVKKAPKNMTSENMNQLMLQRKDRSTLWPYCPPSLSDTASLNHWYSTPSHHTTPKARAYLPQSTPLTHWTAPKITNSRPKAAKAGCRDGLGTK